MYPKNAASPERIAIGAVVQISDGAVQTSGVTITVRGQAGAEGTGGGTTVYGASGIVYYTPLQAETNFTSFVVIASKTGCVPIAQTIVTTASSTPGYVVVGSNTDKTGYSLTATTGLGNQTADITGSLSGSVGSVTGNVGGNVVGSVASVTATVSLSAAERNSVADALLARNVAGGSSTGRIVSEALYVLRNKTDITAGTLTVYATDDSTPAFTAAVTTTAGNPISAIDPA